MILIRPRRPVLGIALTAALLAGCENVGESGRDAELARSRAEKGFTVISSTASRAVFSARGKRVVVEPPEGYCLDEGSLTVTRRSAFAMVAECLDDHRNDTPADGATGNIVEIKMPRSFPGILTVSASGEPAYGSEPGALDAFEALLETSAGLKLLSRGDTAMPGRIMATRRIGGALYVLIEEPEGEGTAFLAPRFWRAFIEINERLVLVTVSSFADHPIAEDAMMGFLSQQMARLRQANDLGTDEEEDEIAARMAVSLALADGAEVFSVIRSERASVTSDGVDPARAPLPPGRTRLARSKAGSPSGSGMAPLRAPQAPARPG